MLGLSDMPAAPEVDVLLEPCQQAAVAHIRERTAVLRPAATADIDHILRMSNVPPSSLGAVLAAVRDHARVAIHFHPDRPAGRPGTSGALPVSRRLLDDGVYRNQFETGISNGSVSAWVGGARDEWERVLFGGAYHRDPGDRAGHHRPATDHAAAVPDPHLRPRYGAVDFARAADGPCPRFGSCFFVLRPAVSRRATFSFGGSQDAPARFGVIDDMHAILAVLLEECFVRDTTLGLAPPIRPAGLVALLMALGDGAADGKQLLARNLDHIVEAQVHGELRLDRDVEALVADPSFRGTETGNELEAMASRYGFGLRWHPGYRLRMEGVPVDFRGPTMPSLAARVARAGWVDAAAIGAGVRDLARSPEAWADRGSYGEVLQELKLLWHVLVRYGEQAVS